MLKMKSKVWIALIGAAVLVGAFLFGRHTTPVQERVVEVEKRVVVEKEQVNIVQQVDAEELVKQVQTIARRNNVKRTVVTTQKPDGTTTTTETEVDRTTTATTTDTNAATKTTENTDLAIVKEVVQVEERIKLVERKLTMKWSASLDAGYYLPGLWGEGLRKNLLPGNAIVGITVSRHLVGPLSVGVWANSAWGAGAQVRWAW